MAVFRWVMNDGSSYLDGMTLCIFKGVRDSFLTTMAEQKSKYLVWLETLHREYTERTSITLFGKQAMLIRLLADVYEVRCRFEKILGRLQQEAFVLEDGDVVYEEWYNPEKWKLLDDSLHTEDLRETFNIKQGNPLPQTYSNILLSPFGKSANFDNDRFRNVVSSLFVLNTIVDEQKMEVAIDGELKKLQKLLLDISNAKRRDMSDEECASLFVGIRDKYLKGFMTRGQLTAAHKKWRSEQIGEIDMDVLCERRVELLLELFDTGFLDDMPLHRKANDTLGFDNYEFEKWEGRMNEAKKYFAKLCRICPYRGDMIDFSNYAKIGRYIINQHIEQKVVEGFLWQMQLIQMVQREMRRLNNIEEEGEETDVNPVDVFADTVKHIMLKAEDDNGTVKKLTARGNGGTYTYNIKGKEFGLVMDDVLANHEEYVKAYLEDADETQAATIKYVAPFIGAILETHLFSPSTMPKKDIAPALESKYGSGTSATSKLASSNLSDKGKTLLNILKSVAKEHNIAE